MVESENLPKLTQPTAITDFSDLRRDFIEVLCKALYMSDARRSIINTKDHRSQATQKAKSDAKTQPV
ncbi:hypothetical protein RRG08_023405 [Elysia crispata]|uniref:Uncharacterized protein n=1 Tax=Elysia crispata TaxID=231223 RepID=A0AAE1CX84_9GAST|nr:hypothetical protein RRG08_023405 [Elysia crispata]